MRKTPQARSDEGMGGSSVMEAYRLVLIEVDQLETAEREIKAELEMARASRDALRQLLKDRGERSTGTTVSLAKIKDTRKCKRHHRGSLTGEVISHAKSILISEGRPLERSELLRQIVEAGVEVTASNPAKFIGRTLWESDDFIHIPREGYWLKDIDIPASDK
ncbi:hypothetical protein [Rhizobium leguminosarum]|uniref:HTH HARE-type domain-containing protein n=1 Tax=Rhizobium leguminosarum TaxID=384 RepID=A0A6P0D9V8_RHILE|nr:hypothetical protein [Rhizobium leguminosarum]MBY5494704.1 hypothetical protein [Rhizobium leguminosarum]MBY5524687.1 hypothetical protein [Rhizobium leguminosarum]NEK48540.1 hypothetical protein [Rhizobium leguminosarum]TBY34481.1 hypothetical protein E0H55_15305 [Rhizobium leguminosarum bv. viciae]TBY42409.1 hypothetical protein E0H60_03290 [Rhizobium leguminosarum bv. viciae]